MSLIVVGIGIVMYSLRGIFDGVSMNLGSKNATLAVSVDAAELQRIKASIAELNRNLFGDSKGDALGRLGSLVETLRDVEALDDKVFEIKNVLTTFSNNSRAVETFLDHQAERMEALANASVGRVLDMITEKDFWNRLKPRLVDMGILGDMDPELVLKVESEKARIQEELRISANVTERAEQAKAEGWVRLALAMSKDFNDHLAFRIAIIVGGCAATCAAFFALRLGAQLLLRHLTIPPLVDETSYSSMWHWPFRAITVSAVESYIFDGDVAAGRPSIVLASAVRESVSDLAYVLVGRRQKSIAQAVALPNAVFYGPPGTGKSLTARRLAWASGLDYAIMSGGNVLGLREEAVPELRRIFDWARQVPSGLVLFIDEAEAFLAARGGADRSPFVQAAVTFFLAQTTSSNTRLVIILATNRVEDLDAAVLSRMPFQIEFGRPDRDMMAQLVEDRKKLLKSLPLAIGWPLPPGMSEADATKAVGRFDTILRDSGVELQKLGFTGRDVQNLFEEFQRRWTLEHITCGKKLTDQAWFQRWLDHRDARGRLEQREPAVLPKGLTPQMFKLTPTKPSFSAKTTFESGITEIPTEAELQSEEDTSSAEDSMPYTPATFDGRPPVPWTRCANPLCLRPSHHEGPCDHGGGQQTSEASEDKCQDEVQDQIQNSGETPRRHTWHSPGRSPGSRGPL